MSLKERYALELRSIRNTRSERSIASHLRLEDEWQARMERAGFDRRQFA